MLIQKKSIFNNVNNYLKIATIRLTLFFLIGISISCIEEKNKIKIIDDETFIANEENENLKLAVREAQRNLNYFIKRLKIHSKDTNYWFSAKTKYETQEEVNHFWFNTLEFKRNDSFMGIIHNEQNWSTTLKIGDTINVHRKDIEDWYIENEIDNHIEGDFTENALFQDD